jgi:hypothetical protein
MVSRCANFKRFDPICRRHSDRRRTLTSKLHCNIVTKIHPEITPKAWLAGRGPAVDYAECFFSKPGAGLREFRRQAPFQSGMAAGVSNV